MVIRMFWENITAVYHWDTSNRGGKYATAFTEFYLHACILFVYDKKKNIFYDFLYDYTGCNGFIGYENRRNVNRKLFINNVK